MTLSVVSIGKYVHFPFEFRSAYQKYLAKQWSSSIVRNVWMFIHRKVHVIIIRMEHILAQVFRICYSWFIQNIGRNDQPINLLLVSTALRYIQWHTNCNTKQLRISNSQLQVQAFQILPAAVVGQRQALLVLPLKINSIKYQCQTRTISITNTICYE